MNLKNKESDVVNSSDSGYLKVGQAADYLSKVVNTEIKGEDILHTALQGNLRLFIEIKEDVFAKNINNKSINITENYTVNYLGQKLSIPKYIILTKGLFILKLTGAARNEIEYIYKLLKNEPTQRMEEIYGSGVLVEDINNEIIYQLQIYGDHPKIDKDSIIEKYNFYHPPEFTQTGLLPHHSNILVLKKELDEENFISIIKKIIEEKNNNIDNAFSGSINQKLIDFYRENKTRSSIRKKENLKYIYAHDLDDPDNKKCCQHDKNKKLHVRNTEQNYFVHINERWFIKFQGGDEGIVNNCTSISVLVEYLKNKFTQISEEKIQDKLTSHLPIEKSKYIPDGLEARLQSGPGIMGSDILSEKKRKSIEISLKDFIQDIIENEEKGYTEEVEDLKIKLEIFKKQIKNSFKGIVIHDDGSIISYNTNVKDRDLLKEKISRNIRDAIKLIKKEEIKNLPEHLTKCLKNTGYIYSPDIDIKWEIME